MREQCVAHGCHTLNQLQLLLRVAGKADSVLELFLLRMDEQGLEISSPWAIGADDSIVQTLWPRVYRAWLEKERWKGCREVAEEVRKEWDQARSCLEACRKLGCAKRAILNITQLRGCQTRWMCNDELLRRQCHLTSSGYTTFISWLPATCGSGNGVSAEMPALTAPEDSGALSDDTTTVEVCRDGLPVVRTGPAPSCDSWREYRRRFRRSLRLKSTQIRSCGDRG